MTTTANHQLLRPSADDQTPATTRLAGIGEFNEGLRWAESVLNDPLETSVQASGMTQAELRIIEQAAGGNAT